MTLLEVLLAVLILGMGLSALTATTSRCLAVIRKARYLERAREMVVRVELEAPLDEEDILNSEESGNFEDVEGYRWTRTVEPVDEEYKPGLFTVTTRVYWTDRNRDVFEEVTTAVYRPDDESLKDEL